MTDHPITPPPELLHQWATDYWGNPITIGEGEKYIAIQAARWGADQELEACCELVRDSDGYDAALGLRAERRPKPPSLKEQALKALNSFEGFTGSLEEVVTIRRALEALDD